MLVPRLQHPRSVDLTRLQFKSMGSGRPADAGALGAEPIRALLPPRRTRVAAARGCMVEAFVGQGSRGTLPSTKGTYRSVLRQLSAPADGQRTIPYPGAPAARPYAPSERTELVSIALAQPKPWRRH